MIAKMGRVRFDVLVFGLPSTIPSPAKKENLKLFALCTRQHDQGIGVTLPHHLFGASRPGIRM